MSREKRKTYFYFTSGICAGMSGACDQLWGHKVRQGQDLRKSCSKNDKASKKGEVLHTKELPGISKRQQIYHLLVCLRKGFKDQQELYGQQKRLLLS